MQLAVEGHPLLHLGDDDLLSEVAQLVLHDLRMLENRLVTLPAMPDGGLACLALRHLASQRGGVEEKGAVAFLEVEAARSRRISRALQRAERMSENFPARRIERSFLSPKTKSGPSSSNARSWLITKSKAAIPEDMASRPSTLAESGAGELLPLEFRRNAHG